MTAAENAKRNTRCGGASHDHSHHHDHGDHHHGQAAGAGAKVPDPQQYSDESASSASISERAAYICPMHPEYHQIGPGNCPICGMALEPEVVALDSPPNHELAHMTLRFRVGLVLALPVLVLEMGGHLVGSHRWVDQTLSNWIQLVFSTPVVLWAGWPFFVRGWQSLVTRNLNMFTLIAMGVGVAYAYSVVATLVPGIFPSTFRGHDGALRSISKRQRPLLS